MVAIYSQICLFSKGKPAKAAVFLNIMIKYVIIIQIILYF